MKIQSLFYLTVLTSFCTLFYCGNVADFKDASQSSTEKEVNYIPYYLKVYEADSLYLVGNYERSFKILDSLFQEFEPIRTENFETKTYLKSAYLSNQQMDEKKYFEQLFTAFGYGWMYLKHDSILLKIAERNQHDSASIALLENQYLRTIDVELRQEITAMVQKENSNISAFFESENEQDWLHLEPQHEKRLLEIFQMKIYPNYKNCCVELLDMKENRDSDITTLLLYTRLDTRMTHFEPLMLQFVKSGECDPFHYALMMDQWYLFSGKNQLYGTYPQAPIVDSAKVDRNRKSIGLPSLAYDDFKWKQQLSSNSQ